MANGREVASFPGTYKVTSYYDPLYDKYTNIKSPHYVFKALAYETLGQWAEEFLSFIDRIETHFIRGNLDLRTKQFLYRRLSLAIQQGTAASILEALLNYIPIDEIHNV